MCIRDRQLTSLTDFTPVNGQLNVSADGCTSIAFQNNSSDEFDSEGRNIGYRMVINNLWEILPGGQYAINQNIGFKDGSMYRITFKAVTGTPPTATQRGVVCRVNTKTQC